MILDHEDEIDTIIKYIKNKRTLLVPILCSPVMHSSIHTEKHMMNLIILHQLINFIGIDINRYRTLIQLYRCNNI